MDALHHRGYYPLTEYSIHNFVPQSSGLYLLAVQTESGQFINFYATYSDNLSESLLGHLQGTPNFPQLMPNDASTPICYFSYLVFSSREDVSGSLGKLLLNTSDPVSKLNVINCN